MPRRLVYVQAFLLGLTALTFFMLGIMVGKLTSGNSVSERSLGQSAEGWMADCRVCGSVSFREDGQDLANVGAVVILIPKEANVTPAELLSPQMILPGTFVALDNPVIAAISEAGGSVVRTDAEGSFNVLVDPQRQFYLLVLCHGSRSQDRQLSGPQRSFLESWFRSADQLVSENDFLWRELSSSSDTIELGVMSFE